MITMNEASLIQQIQDLKKKYDITIVAHFYQALGIQKVADFIGDSLELAKIAKNQIKTKYVVFAGVKFMAETASILNPNRTILLPDKSAGCPLADSLKIEVIQQYRQKYPKLPLVVYINTTAETKANADLCCTSANAVKMVESAAKLWKTDTILFGPDKNLAEYTESQTKIKTIKVPGDGCCPFHNLFTIEDVQLARKKHPQAILLVHPESPSAVAKAADFVGSTSAMVKYAETHREKKEFIVGTEIHLNDYLQTKYPTQKFFPLSEKSLCEEMQKITLEKILNTIQSIGTNNEKKFEVRVPSKIAQNSIKSIEKMLELSQ